jgi:hypothetical protein
MAALNLDAEMHRAMTAYIIASNRVRVAEERDDVQLLATAEQEQRHAAKAYELALVKRGWRAPVGELSKR